MFCFILYVITLLRFHICNNCEPSCRLVHATNAQLRASLQSGTCHKCLTVSFVAEWYMPPMRNCEPRCRVVHATYAPLYHLVNVLCSWVSIGCLVRHNKPDSVSLGERCVVLSHDRLHSRCVVMSHDRLHSRCVESRSPTLRPGSRQIGATYL